MQYRLVSAIVAGALFANINGLPIGQPEGQDGIQLGTRTATGGWSKDKRDPTPPDSIWFGNPSTEITWGKEKREEPSPLDTVSIGRRQGDIGGELDPHGSDGRGNPIGGRNLVY